MGCTVTRGKRAFRCLPWSYPENWGKFIHTAAFRVYILQLNIADGATSKWSSSCVLCEGHRVRLYCKGKSFRSAFTAWIEHIWRTLSNQGLFWLISSHRMGFLLTKGKACLKFVVAGFMWNYAEVSILGEMENEKNQKHDLLFSELPVVWNTRSTINHARVLQPFHFTNDLKQIYSTWN